MRVCAAVRILGALLAVVSCCCGAAALADDAAVEQGRRIYLEGALPSGAPLEGVRAGDTKVSGAAAACVNCHRRSGMGTVEGDIQIRPITVNYLYGIGKNMAVMDPLIGKRLNPAHVPYGDETLARAIREGVNSDGAGMNALMPRYTLADSDMLALQAYLKQLSRDVSPGVDADTIHLATVIAPGVDAARRKVLIDMLTAAVAQKNGSTLPGRHHMASPAAMLSGSERRWVLDVWELHGEPATWGAQLEEDFRGQPVFAILSGLSETTWEPVADFCERTRVPCWFPSVDVPPGGAERVYSLYFSRGIVLDAELLAKHLRGRSSQPRRVIQVRRDDAVGRTAAETLAKALSGSGIAVDDRVVREGGADALRAALKAVGRDVVVVLWLRAADLALLPKQPPASVPVFFAARLVRGERAPLPAAWKSAARLIYPYQLPEKRDANLASFHTWMQMRQFPDVDEAMQSEVFFSVSYLTDTLAEMLNNLYGDYLIERAESMLSGAQGAKAADETRMRTTLGRPGEVVEHYGPQISPYASQRRVLDQLTAIRNRQTGTSIYPNLSLAPGQRFASKGGYIVRFAEGGADRLSVESDWISP
jgi:hypothetical protein